MATKTRIIGDLGEDALLLPDNVNKGLIGNDQVKYYFTLLQSALGHADNPDTIASNLCRERLACGVDDDDLDTVIERRRRTEDGYTYIPFSARLLAQIIAGIKGMYAPVSTAAQAGVFNNADVAPDALRQRIDVLTNALPPIEDDKVKAETINTMTRALREEGDSIHLLVMDLHKALTLLQRSLATENLDGANIYQVTQADRELVKAFMKGLNETAPLKFDHPGLGTTATRVAAKLVIQNDIGTTDAHVLVIHVQERTVSATYTDIHLDRLQFFISLFKPYNFIWEDTSARAASGFEEENYYMRVGTFTASDADELKRYLAYLGSRIVFLIDWNKARKQLRNFVKNRDAVGVLKWSANNNVGHRGFLALGGERLIYDAIQYAAKGHLHYGEPLSEILGHDQAIDYLKYVLKITSQGLSSGRSEQLIRDEVKTELLKYFHTTYQSLLGVAEQHAELIYDIANAVRNVLLRVQHGDAEKYIRRTAARSRQWEHKADVLLNEARAMFRHTPDTSNILKQLMEEADDAADNLEECAYLLTLLSPASNPSRLYDTLQTLSGQVVEASQEFIKCLDSASHVRRGGNKEDLDDFLEAVASIVKLEHDTDDANRNITSMVVKEATDFRQLHLVSEIARTLEEAADSLSRSGLLLRAHVLDKIMAT